MNLRAALPITRHVNAKVSERSCAPQGRVCARAGPGDLLSPGRFLRNGLLMALAWSMSACSTLHVPAARPTFGVKEFVEAETEGIILRARVIVEKESYSDLFDDDLPRMGIIAAWISLENRSQQEATVDPEQWHLMVAGHRCPAMSPNDMLDRYYRERRIRMYTVRTDERVRDRLGKLSLQRGRLAPGVSAEGFVFFRIDGSPPPSWNLDAVLMARGIRLGGERKLDMQLPLYAHS